MYSVYQHWDPLRVCAVGQSYPPEFYDYITNKKVRSVFYKIAEETEEDYLKLIKLLESFNVEVIRPNMKDIKFNHFQHKGKYNTPPMCPRDYTAMIGTTFYMPGQSFTQEKWDTIKGSEYSTCPPATYQEFLSYPAWMQEELIDKFYYSPPIWDSIEKACINQRNKIVYDTTVNSAMVSRIGKDLYFGTEVNLSDIQIDKTKQDVIKMFPDYRCHIVNTQGHTDGTFCPVTPGLIISLKDIPSYANTFPDWEVIYLPGQSWSKVQSFLELKEKNKGKWWVPGQELNDDFTDFVEHWMSHWVGYVEETVFDVNMLVIDEKNVVCNNYNEKVFDALSRYGVTPHVVNFRHRYFWDGGIHCITSDLHREGTMQDYFPERS